MQKYQGAIQVLFRLRGHLRSRIKAIPSDTQHVDSRLGAKQFLREIQQRFGGHAVRRKGQVFYWQQRTEREGLLPCFVGIGKDNPVITRKGGRVLKLKLEGSFYVQPRESQPLNRFGHGRPKTVVSPAGIAVAD